MTIAVPISYPVPGSGYTRGDGRYIDVESIVLLPAQTISGVGTVGGITVGSVWDIGKRSSARLALAVTAKSGTSPTVDVTIQTSPDGINDWKSAGTFAQKTDCANAVYGPVMGAVTSAGTTPPTVTLTSTGQTLPVNFKMKCTTLGARGTAYVAISVDGGVTYADPVVTAATIAVVDKNGTDTGIVVNYANAAAAEDNTWVASTISHERKSFNALDRFIRPVVLLGGSSTPTMACSIIGELV